MRLAVLALCYVKSARSSAANKGRFSPPLAAESAQFQVDI